MAISCKLHKTNHIMQKMKVDVWLCLEQEICGDWS